MRETWVQSLGREDPLEKGIATHFNILIWRIPWTLQAMGLQRVRHDWETFTSLHFTPLIHSSTSKDSNNHGLFILIVHIHWKKSTYKWIHVIQTHVFQCQLFQETWASQVALVVKNLPANAENTGSIPRSRRSPRGGYGNPLQYSCLENPMDRVPWGATVHGAAECDTTEWLSTVKKQ